MVRQVTRAGWSRTACDRRRWQRAGSVPMNAFGSRREVGIDRSLVECIIVALPEAGSAQGVAAALAGLVDSAVIRILDLATVTRDRRSGQLKIIQLGELEAAARALIDDDIGDLLTNNDVTLAAAALRPGSTGIVILVEDRWAASLSAAAQSAGGRVIGGRRIPQSGIEAALAESPWPVATARHPQQNEASSNG